MSALPPESGHSPTRSGCLLWAMCGRLRVGKGFLHECSIGRCSHVFGLTNQARWQLLEECQYMTTLELTTEDDITSGIDAMDLENRLRDVETNCRNRLHG